MLLFFLFLVCSISIADKEIKNGKLEVKIRYHRYSFSIGVIHDTYGLCQEETGLQCPLKAGNLPINFKQEVPSSAPGVS